MKSRFQYNFSTKLRAFLAILIIISLFVVVLLSNSYNPLWAGILSLLFLAFILFPFILFFTGPQEIEIDNNKIILKFIGNRKKTFLLTDINSIKQYKNLFIGSGKNIELTLNNGQKFIIWVIMNDLRALEDSLRKRKHTNGTTPEN